MSIKLMSKVWAMECDNNTQKLILLKIADNASDEGGCWPSHSTIAKHCQCDRRTVIRHIKILEEKGWLRVQRRFDNQGCKTSNFYILNLPDHVTQDHMGSDTMSHTLVTEDHIPSDTGSHKPSFNHKNEPSKEPITVCSDAEKCFEDVWWCYPTKVNKKKAKTLFVNYIKKHKLEPNEFAAKLVTDIQKRVSIEQFGFDRLHFTTYINGERWNDDYKFGDNRRMEVMNAANDFVNGYF